ncbi:MAG: sulfotransferase, partial [Deltaproteobacteria bacterium]|nr:sulfotransferase [Deltaproteobacteria bacterium]
MNSNSAEPASGIMAKFEEDALLKQAMQSTGLSDFGDEVFREGLRVLIEALEGEAGLNDFGRAFAQAEIMKHLENRLRVTEDLKRHPEILDVEVATPLIIVSLPRTGTTLLHNLLAQDPDTRYAATWECNLLSPPPETATWESDPRVEHFARAIEAAHGSGAPGFEDLHPMGSTLPEECVVLLGFDFTS